jgi:tetratricopeptide (TPR) repeat protein
VSNYSLKQYTPVILVVISFAVYLSTICPTVYLGDSGELTAAAFSLGTCHPSGYPIFALLGKLFCLIPIGNIGFRMNLMSVFFSLATVWIVYSIIYKITSSIASSITGAFTLAFTPLFWGQGVSAEVYPLHSFFAALIIKLLIYWDEKRDLCRLALFVFIVGLSFLNHLQTVMMAPPVLLFLFLTDRKGCLSLRTLTFISIFFIYALTIYIYLPIRTHAGAAIHWGDPDSLSSFWVVVSGQAHRSNYIFNKTIMDYIIRSKDAFITIVNQFGIISLFAIWGFFKLPSFRWKLFYSGIIIFDFFYTVFLNTVRIEVTTFNLSTLIVIAILAGLGVSNVLNRCRKVISATNRISYKLANIVCCAVPVIFIGSNFNFCDQSRNYTAYENALNIFRTIDPGGTIFIEGDNKVFSVVYNRIIERMREDVNLYDRYNLFFKTPYLGDTNRVVVGKLEDLQAVLEKSVIEKEVNNGIYFTTINPNSISMPENYRFVPYGLLSRVIKKEPDINQSKRAHIWNYYVTESLEDNFDRDYMNREITADFHYRKGKELLLLGGTEAGLRRLKLASQIGYNDELIHPQLALLFSDFGFFDKAKAELEKSLIYCQSVAGVYNDWGYYYAKHGDLKNAIDSINKAIEIDSSNTLFYNNLGSLLLDSGRKDSALKAFRKSLSINKNQDAIKKILQENEVKSIKGE